MSQLIASSGNKEDLEKMINKYYFSSNYIITENNEVYNTRKQCVLDGVKVEEKKKQMEICQDIKGLEIRISRGGCVWH